MNEKKDESSIRRSISPSDSGDTRNKRFAASSRAYNDQQCAEILENLNKNGEFPVDFDETKCEHEGLKDFIELTRRMHAAIAADDLEELSLIISQNRHLNYFYNTGNVSAAAAAIGHHKFKTFEYLLAENVKLPQSFKIQNLVDEESKRHFEMIRNLHDAIKRGRKEEAKRIVNKNPSFRYFYNLDNKSASTLALECKKFKIYEFLLRNNHFHPEQDIKITQKELSSIDQEKVREIHYKLKQNVEEPHLLILLSNSSVGHDYRDLNDKLNCLRDAFKDLNRIKPIDTLLKLAALFIDSLNIVFDFNRDSVYYLDPEMDKKTFGTFYSHGRIFIGAKQLLSSERNITLGTIIHEICHFVLYMIFENGAKPYYKDDQASAKDLDEILNICEHESGIEDIVDWVYGYPEEHQHAEIIVRVPHMLAHYYDDPVKFNDLKSHFEPLFNHFEEKVMPTLTRRMTELQQLSLEYVIEWTDLSDYQKSKVFKSSVNFREENFEFSELFGDDKSNNNCYSILNSQQLNLLLKGTKSLNLDDPRNEFLQAHINLTYSECSDQLKGKIENAEVVFQGVETRLGSLIDKQKEIFEKLDRKQVLSLLKNEKTLKVGKELEAEDKFYVKRRFLSDYFVELLYLTETFREVFLELLSKSKCILLSDHAGNGKSTTLKNLATEIKTKYPEKWVKYVDLKTHFEIWKKMGENFNILETLKVIFDIQLEFEFEILKNRFQSSKLVIFWDGFDEISPTYSKAVLNLLKSIKDSSECIQLVSTRCHCEKEVSEALNCEIFHFFPLSEEEKKEFIMKFFKHKGLSDQQISDAKLRVTELLANIEENEFCYKTSPLLLGMIAEISAHENPSIDISNLYQVYEHFVETKIEILKLKNIDLVREEEKKRSNKRKFPTWKILQYFALTVIFQNWKEYFKNLKLVEKFDNNPQQIDRNELSRCGILIFDSEGKASFVHRTFAEFLVAQYLVDNVYEVESYDESSDSEWDLRMQLIMFILTSLDFLKVGEFVEGYLKSQPDFRISSKCYNFLEKNGSKEFYKKLTWASTLEPFSLKSFVKNFPMTNAELERLWRFKENGTVVSFCAANNPRYFFEILNEIKEILSEKFPGEREKHKEMLFGINQKGTFALAVYKCNILMTGNNDFEFNLIDFIKELEVSIDSEKFENFACFDDFYEAHLKNELSVEERRQIFLHNFLVFTGIPWNVTKSLQEMQEILTPEEFETIICKKSEYFDEFLTNEESLLYLAEDFESFNHCLELLKKFSKKPLSFYLISENKRFILVQVNVMQNSNFFPVFWDIIQKECNKESRREILWRYCYATLINFGNKESFKLVEEVYMDHFDKEEMIEICNTFKMEKKQDI